MYATRAFGLVLAAGLLVFTGTASGQTPMGTAFTYQGQLMDNDSKANGQYDFEFKLCDDPVAPCQVAGTTVVDYVDDHQVDDGLFTVEIDFGSDVFNGQARWLELGVRPGASSGADPYTTLSPRQELTPSPHALRAKTGVGGPDALNVTTDDKVGIGTNSPKEQLDVAGNIHASGTITSGSSITIDGTTGSENINSTGDLDLQTGGTSRLFIESAGEVGIGTDTPTYQLDVRTDSEYAAIYGENTKSSGQNWGVHGVADADGEWQIGVYGTAHLNTTSAHRAEGVRGYADANDSAGSAADAYGGSFGAAADGVAYGVYGSSWTDTNTAYGVYGRSLGSGTGTTAYGLYGTASGAETNWAGYFDGNGYFSGDVGIGTTSPGHPLEMGSGAHVTSGGVWTDASDRDRKDGFASVDPREVLRRVDALELSTWHFRVDDSAVRHMGAMAQDFYAAFGLGNDERHIAALDTGGVALAAIQGLYEIVKEKEAKIEALRAQNDAQVAELEARLAALENLVKQADAGQQGGRR